MTCRSRRWYGRAADDQVRAALEQVARARGATAAAVALSWVLTRSPTSTPLVGATEPAHLGVVEEASALRLEPAEVDALEADYLPRLSYGH